MSDGAEVEITHMRYSALHDVPACGVEYERIKLSDMLSEVNCTGCIEARVAAQSDEIKASTPRPFHELFDSGLLWLINSTVFHPRGYAMQVHIDYPDSDYTAPKATGWSIIGDGREPWQIGCDDESQRIMQLRFDQTRELLP